MDLDRIANASRVADDLMNNYHVFQTMHPHQPTPIFYQIAGADVQDLAYAIHKVQSLLYRYDRAIEELQRIRQEG